MGGFDGHLTVARDGAWSPGMPDDGEAEQELSTWEGTLFGRW